MVRSFAVRCIASLALLSAMSAPAHAVPAPGELFVARPADGLAALRAESEECAYCHVVDAAGEHALYRGDLAAYEEASDHAHTAGSTPCLSCHVRHGEQGMAGALEGALLRVLPYQLEIVDALAGGDADAITNGTARAAGWDGREIQLTAFCTSCHRTYSNGPGQDIVVPESAADGSIVMTHRHHHPLATLDRALHYATTMYGTQRIAAKPTTGCTSCHAAGTVDGARDFPHSTPGSVYFLVSGDDADSPCRPAESAGLDGVCTRCHQWKDSAGDRHGVGIDF